MFFFHGTPKNSDGEIDYCKILYPGQSIIQRMFITLSFLCIPVMLFAKPFILFYRHKHKIGVCLKDFGSKIV